MASRGHLNYDIRLETLLPGFTRAEHPNALISSVPYPPVDLPKPRQVTGRAGDVVLARYLLGHNVGVNRSEVMREVIYFRLLKEGHRGRWRECVQDPLLEFEPVREAVGGLA